MSLHYGPMTAKQLGEVLMELPPDTRVILEYEDPYKGAMLAEIDTADVGNNTIVLCASVTEDDDTEDGE